MSDGSLGVFWGQSWWGLQRSPHRTEQKEEAWGRPQPWSRPAPQQLPWLSSHCAELPQSRTFHQSSLTEKLMGAGRAGLNAKPTQIFPCHSRTHLPCLPALRPQKLA